MIVDDSTVIECLASGVPEPEIAWLRSGQPIDFEADEHLYVRSDGQQLVIQEAVVSDTAVYTCIAVNEAGQAEQNYDLEVWGE